MRKYKIVYQTESILSTEQTLLYVIEDSAMYPFTESKDITIPSLQPYTFYIFTLVVFNDAGYSPNVSVSARTDAAGNQFYYGELLKMYMIKTLVKILYMACQVLYFTNLL